MKDFSKYSAIIIGAGDATGGALTKKFASHGYKVCPARRPGSIDKVNKLAEEINSSGGWAKGFGVDARDEDAIKSFFKEVEEEIAPIDVVIFNPLLIHGSGPNLSSNERWAINMMFSFRDN